MSRRSHAPALQNVNRVRHVVKQEIRSNEMQTRIPTYSNHEQIRPVPNFNITQETLPVRFLHFEQQIKKSSRGFPENKNQKKKSRLRKTKLKLKLKKN